ncbi:MAG: SDR family oxidoreductase [Desulfurococcales archaeon]|nr:SDR family oxidoreductase [Desulfurococcales archaeon]MCE4629670.1 SDR family oxidoreductase [Desulfurococcales archaeon]
MECELSLQGLRAAVTASTKGIGNGIARVLLECGAKVVINGRTEEGVKEALSKLSKYGDRVHGVAADLSNEGEAERFVKESVDFLGGLDALVYVPPPVPGGRFMALGMRLWRLSYRLLIEAAIEAVSAAYSHLIDSDNASITFITSIAAWEPLPEIATSSVLRPGLHAMTILLARELGPDGIRVNAVIPGYIETDRLVSVAGMRAKEKGTSVDEELRKMAMRVPLGRLGDPTDIGWLVAFLASPRATYITGALIPVSGGLHSSVH